MYTRNNIYLCSQRTNLGNGTSVRTLVIFQDHLTYGLLLVLIYSLAQNLEPLFLLCKCLFQALGDLTDVLLTLLLLIGEDCLFHLCGRYNLFDSREQLFRYCAAGVAVLFLAALCYDLVDERDNLLVYLVSLVDSLDHLCLGNLVSSCLDHDDFFSGGCYGQLQVGYLIVCLTRVYDELSVDHADLCHGAGTCERNIRDRRCNSGAQHCCQLRAAGGIYGKNQVVQGYVVPVILREQRTHGTVDNTGCKDGVLGSLTLTLVEASRDLAYGIQLLLVLYA